MTKNGIETLELLKELGIDPRSFNKETAAIMQKMVALKGEGWCDKDYLIEHIFPDKPALMRSALCGLEHKKEDVEFLEKLGVDKRDLDAIKSMIPSDAGESALYFVSKVCANKAGFDVARLDLGQRQVIYETAKAFGPSFAVSICDPDIPEDTMYGIFCRAEQLQAAWAGSAT